jgi:Nucleosome assembly protein (NAP)
LIRCAVRKQVLLTAPLYSRRSKTVAQIPNFWPLVLEQAPPDIDQYIQPSDSALLLSSLLHLSVSHFEIDRDPRSVSIRFEFAENEYFEDKVLEKKFWHRRSRDGWSGLVSEPVAIKWKTDRDLTGGLLDMVVKAWEADKATVTASESNSNGSSNGAVKALRGLTPEQKALKKKIENTGMGGLSFFAWFGFIGRHISAEESAAATALEKQKRAAREARKNNKRKSRSRSDTPESSSDEEESVEGEVGDDDLGMSLEIFPDGDDLAVAFTEDLWPGAIKYFSEFSPFCISSERLVE